MPAKCNLNPYERETAFRTFPAQPNTDEMEQLEEQFTHYLFYHNLPGSGRAVRCSCCGLLEVGHRFRHDVVSDGNLISCPQCNVTLVCKPAGRYGRGRWGDVPGLSERHNAVFLRTAEDGAVTVSAGVAYADWHMAYDGIQYTGDELTGLGWPEVEILYDERERYYMAPGKLAHWSSRGSLFRLDEHLHAGTGGGWESRKSAGEPVPLPSFMYSTADEGRYAVIGWESLSRSSLRYSQCEAYFHFPAELTRGRRFRNVVSYLAWYCLRPQMEMLYKLGFYGLIEELLEKGGCACRPNWRASNPAGFFRLSKPEVKLLLASANGADALAFWREVQGEMSFAAYMSTGCVRFLSRDRLRQVRDLCRELGLPMLRTLRRLGDITEVELWVDYIRMARQLNLDLTEETVVLPRNLRQRHDTLMEQIEYQTNVEALQQYRGGRLKRLRRKYEMEAGGFCIRVPTCASEIRSEGRALRHCVGGYAARHMQGKTVILFLRSVEEPDKPLCTIEMAGTGWTEIRQIHGYQNDRNGPMPRQAYKALLDLWLPWLAAGSPRDGAGHPVLMAREKVEVAV